MLVTKQQVCENTGALGGHYLELGASSGDKKDLSEEKKRKINQAALAQRLASGFSVPRGLGGNPPENVKPQREMKKKRGCSLEHPMIADFCLATTGGSRKLGQGNGIKTYLGMGNKGDSFQRTARTSWGRNRKAVLPEATPGEEFSTGSHEKTPGRWRQGLHI